MSDRLSGMAEVLDLTQNGQNGSLYAVAGLLQVRMRCREEAGGGVSGT